MFVKAITIRKENYYGGYGKTVEAETPYEATIEIQGQNGETKLRLSPDMSVRILALIADEVAAAGRVVADAMTAEFITGKALPAPDELQPA